MATKQNLRIPLRVVFYKDGSDWIAHCLEFDLCGSGDSRSAALAGLSKAIVAQLDFALRNPNRKNLFSPAPSEIQSMFFSGKAMSARLKLALNIKKFGNMVIERPEYREYRGDRSRTGSGATMA